MPPLFGLLAIISAFISAIFLTPQPLLLELPQNSSGVLSASKWTIRDVVFGVSLPDLRTEGKHTQALASIREVGRETVLEISRVAGSAVDALHKAQAGFEEKRAQAYKKIVHGTRRTTSAVSHGMHLAAESGAGAGEFVKNTATDAVHGLTARAGQAMRASEDAVVDAAKTVGGTLHKGFDFAKETGGDIVDGFGRGVSEVEKGLLDTGRAIGSKFHEATEGVQHRLNDVWEFEEATRHTLADAGYKAWDLVFQTEEACVDKVRQTEEAIVGTGKDVYARGSAVGRCIRRKVFRSPEKSQATSSQHLLDAWHKVYDDVTGCMRACSNGACSALDGKISAAHAMHTLDDTWQGLAHTASKASDAVQRKAGEAEEAIASASSRVVEGADSLGKNLKGRGAEVASSFGMAGNPSACGTCTGESSAGSAYMATKARAQDLLSWAEHSLEGGSPGGGANEDGVVDEYGHKSGSPSLFQSKDSGQGWNGFGGEGRSTPSISWQFIWAPLGVALLRSLNLALFSIAWGALVFTLVGLRPALGSMLPEPYLTNVQRTVAEKALTVATMWAAVGLGTEISRILNGKRLDYWHLAELVVVLLVGGLDWLGGTPLRKKLATQKLQEDLALANLILSESEEQETAAEITTANAGGEIGEDISAEITTGQQMGEPMLSKDEQLLKTRRKCEQVEHASLDEEIRKNNSGADVFTWIVTTALTLQLWRLSCRLVV